MPTKKIQRAREYRATAQYLERRVREVEQENKRLHDQNAALTQASAELAAKFENLSKE